MMCVESTVAVIPPRVKRIIHYRSAVLADFVQGVRPSVGELGTQPSPRPESEDRLKGIVVGCPDGVELENVGEMGESNERPSAGLLVYLAHQGQIRSFAANVAN